MWLYAMLNSVYRPNSISCSNLRLKVHLRGFNVLVCSLVGDALSINVFFVGKRMHCQSMHFFSWEDDSWPTLKGFGSGLIISDWGRK
jgi:hypothetical protein